MRMHINNREALLKMARDNLHPRAEYSDLDNFVVVSAFSPFYRQECGYIGVEDGLPVIVDTQNDEDRIAYYIPHNVVTFGH